jgi:undecaprenyl-diphosphatase
MVSFFRAGWFAVILGTWLFSQGIAFASFTEHPDIFSYEDIHVRADQTIGKLILAKSNATVDGVVTDGIIVVDGNLLITSTAKVKGTVIVLGGYVEHLEGARLNKRIWNITPYAFPMADIVVAGFIIMGAASLVMVPLAIWLTARLLQNTFFYMRIKEQLFTLQQRYPALYIAAGLSVSGLMLLFFSEMAWETLFRKTMDVFDNAFIWLVRYFASPTVDQVMIFITNLGYGYSYGIIAFLVFLLLAFGRRWHEITGLALCLAGGAALNSLLKHLFERARPDLFRVVEATGYSFPSGHAMISLCFYGMLAFLIARNINSLSGRLVIISLTVLLVAAIGISRIYLGVHYPTDVVAGYTAGAMWLFCCISFLAWWERRRFVNRVP